jgi:hypothetical protein
MQGDGVGTLGDVLRQPKLAAGRSGVAGPRASATRTRLTSTSASVGMADTRTGGPQQAPQRAQEAAREADRAEAEAWSVRMEGYGGPAQPSPTIAQCLNGGMGWLEAECARCKTPASLPLDAIRRPRDTPIWKLEASLKCRSCKKGRYAPPVRMTKLTETREITPYKWVHPDEER